MFKPIIVAHYPDSGGWVTLPESVLHGYVEHVFKRMKLTPRGLLAEYWAIDQNGAAFPYYKGKKGFGNIHLPNIPAYAIGAIFILIIVVMFFAFRWLYKKLI